MGGYAGRHHEALLAMEAAGTARLVATCDPAHAKFAAQHAAWGLKQRQVAVYDDYRRMLEELGDRIDILTVPTPIPLHAEMHRAGVGRGMAVYLEKPPTLDPRELETMIETDRAARVPTLVGFNFIGEPERQTLKRRLLAGEFGALRTATLLGLWPRPTPYYERNGWAGRLVGDDGRLILDSCVGNALSHHVHNLLHWAGVNGQNSWAAPTAVRARLLRAHAIQGADTFFIETATDAGVTLRIALSHACDGPNIQRETLVCERAVIHYVTNDRAEVLWHDGRVETIVLSRGDAQVHGYGTLIAALRGEPGARPPTTLRDSRPFVHLHALAYVAAGCIDRFPADEIETTPTADGTGVFHAAKDMLARSERFLAEGVWPWGEPAPAAGPDRLSELDVIARRLATEAH
jgi:predicted dehydrogenase